MFCRKEKKGYIRRMHLIDQYFELLLLGDRPLNCFETTGHPSNHLDKGSEERVETASERQSQSNSSYELRHGWFRYSQGSVSRYIFQNGLCKYWFPKNVPTKFLKRFKRFYFNFQIIFTIGLLIISNTYISGSLYFLRIFSTPRWLVCQGVTKIQLLLAIKSILLSRRELLLRGWQFHPFFLISLFI